MNRPRRQPRVPRTTTAVQATRLTPRLLVVRTSAGSWVASCDRVIWMPARTWHEHRAYGTSTIHTVGFDVADPPPLPDTPAIVSVTPLLRELLVALTEPGVSQPEVDRIRCGPKRSLASRIARADLVASATRAAARERLCDRLGTTREAAAVIRLG